jgi:hypothetical protein
VPLKEVWEFGARLWSVNNRTRDANDLGFYATLIAVTATSTRQRATGTQRCGCRHAPLHGAPTPFHGTESGPSPASLPSPDVPAWERRHPVRPVGGHTDVPATQCVSLSAFAAFGPRNTRGVLTLI